MTRSISSVLREAAQKYVISDSLCCALPLRDEGSAAFFLAREIRGFGYFGDLTNQERSAFLYLCSLIAEDDE